MTEKELIDRCLAGDSQAWSELYDEYHFHLLALIRSMYRGRISDPNLAEEVAARVWFTLVKDECALLRRFDPNRGGKFATFLALVARSQVQQHFRSEQRRRLREAVVSLKGSTKAEQSEKDLELDFAETFLSSLTPAETAFLENCVLSASDSTYSRTNTWQLRHRILGKLRVFLT